MARRPAPISQPPGRPLETLSADVYPTLAAVLDKDPGGHLRAELEQLLGHPLTRRAPRRRVKRIARLRSAHYVEVVLVIDISSTGVRILVQRDQPLDLAEMVRMQLVVMLPQGRRLLPVSVVRVCGRTTRTSTWAAASSRRTRYGTDRVRERNHIFGAPGDDTSDRVEDKKMTFEGDARRLRWMEFSTDRSRTAG